MLDLENENAVQIPVLTDRSGAICIGNTPYHLSSF